MAEILIKNGRIWNGKNFFCGDILTSGNVIAKIAKSIPSEADFILDADRKIVTAGLVDLHVHMRGIAPPEFGIQAEMSCFPFGVTAANDAGAVQGNRALLDSFMLKNTVFVSVGIQDNHADLTQAAARLAVYGDKAVGLKVYFDETVSDVRDISPLREVCSFAHTKGLPVMVHCSNSPVSMEDILNTLDAGDILTHAFHGGKNNAAEDGFENMRKAQKRGVIIDAGLAGHVHTDFSIFRQGIENGILPDVISTDITACSAYTRGGRYGMTMCMSIAKELGMCEKEILKAVTSNPAGILGKENEWGFLKESGPADMAVLAYKDEGFDLTDKAGNHIKSHNGYRCVLTVSDGQIVYKH